MVMQGGGYSQMAPSGKGGIEVSPTGQVKSVGYKTGEGFIYTPATPVEEKQAIAQISQPPIPQQQTISQQIAAQPKSEIGTYQGTSLRDVLASPMPFGEKVSAAGGFILTYGLFGRANGKVDYEQKRAEREADILRRGKWEVPYDVTAGMSTVIPTSITPYTKEELGGGLTGGTGMPGGAEIVLREEASWAAEKELLPGYQARVTEYTTEAELADINKEYQKAIETRTYEIYEKYFKGVRREQIGIGIARAIPTTLAIGGTIAGVSLILPPAASLFFKAAIGTAGLVSIYRNPKSISTTIDIKTGAIIKESYTLSATIKMAGYGALLLGGAYGMQKMTEREILSLQLEPIKEKPFQFKEIRIGEGEQLSYLKAQRMERGIIQELTLKGKIIQTDAGEFIMPGAKGVLRTKGAFDWSIYPEKYGTKIVAKQTFELGAKGTVVSLEDVGSGRLALSLAKTTIVPKTEAGIIYRGGLPYEEALSKMAKTTKLIPDTYTQDIGLGISERIEPDLFKGMGGRLREIDITKGRIEYKSTLDALGITKVIDIKDLKVGYEIGGISKSALDFGTAISETQLKSTFLLGTSGSVGKVSAPLIAETAKIPIAFFPSVIEQKQRGVTKQLTAAIPRTELKQIIMPSVVSGIDVITRTRQDVITRTRQRGGLVSLPRLDTSLMQINRLAVVPVTIPETTETTSQISKLTITPITPTITGFELPFAPIPIIPFLPKFPQVGWGEGFGRGFGVGRGYKYQPSIGAILKGMKVPKIGKAEKFAELTGFLPRPMITGRRKKKK